MIRSGTTFAWRTAALLIAFAGALAAADVAPNLVLDQRHGHNRAYPAPGTTVTTLPSDHRIVRHGDKNYYYGGGVWYLAAGSRYVAILPPAGVVVPVLPPHTTTVWVGTVAHYYAGGVYYVWRAPQQVYAVAPTPPLSDVTTDRADLPDLLSIQATRGQSDARLADDRYQCHRWAFDQSGFDPAEPGGGVAPAEYRQRRAHYRQALSGCLEIRGYHASP